MAHTSDDTQSHQRGALGPRSKPHIDPAPNGCYKYFITLTSRDDFTSEQHDAIVAWHRHNSEKTLLVAERHDSGRIHYHSVIHCRVPKQAAKVTQKLERLYKQIDLEVVKRVSIVVKRQTDDIGLFHYLTKDIPEGDRPLLCIGWAYSWIKEQCLANIRKIPYKVLAKDKHMMRSVSAVARVVQWAQAAGYPLTGKESFIHVVTSMQAEGYQFDNIKTKFLYAQVMAVSGNLDVCRSMWEDALFALR